MGFPLKRWVKETELSRTSPSSQRRRKLNDVAIQIREVESTDLGNLSASNMTVSMPSRARQQAAYEPARPSPIPSTEVWVGTDMLFQQ